MQFKSKWGHRSLKARNSILCYLLFGFSSPLILSLTVVLQLLTSKFFKSWSKKEKIKQPDIRKVILIWGKYIKLCTILKYFNIYFRILVSFTMYEYHTTFPSSFSQFFFFFSPENLKKLCYEHYLLVFED